MRLNLGTLPNLLTLFRLAIMPLLAILLEKNMGLWACLVLTIAGISDVLDGYFARKHKQESAFGKLMDPVADKILLCVSVVFLAADTESSINPYLAVLLLSREFLVTGLRAFMSSHGVVMPAGQMGKYKMLFQFIGLGGIMIGHSLPPLPAREIGTAMLWSSVFLSYWSMFRYLQKSVIALKMSGNLEDK